MMYQDLEATYLWFGMKRDVEEYVPLCDTCQSQGRTSTTSWIVTTFEST
jgi:hypothetical protein